MEKIILRITKTFAYSLLIMPIHLAGTQEESIKIWSTPINAIAIKSKSLSLQYESTKGNLKLRIAEHKDKLTLSVCHGQKGKIMSMPCYNPKITYTDKHRVTWQCKGAAHERITYTVSINDLDCAHAYQTKLKNATLHIRTKNAFSFQPYGLLLALVSALCAWIKYQHRACKSHHPKQPKLSYQDKSKALHDLGT